MKKLLSSIKNQENNIIALGLVALLVILVIPLLMLARYNVMSADDYSYALMTEPVWKASNNIWSALIAEMKVAIDFWREWQGTYFSDWLSFVLTSAFAVKAYYIVAWVTTIPLILSMLYLGYVVIKKGMSLKWSDVLIGTVPWIIYQILLPPSGVEAFFWMCGAVLYTTAFAISLFHISVNISIFINEKRGGNIRWYEIIILLLLGFIQGGMNYIIGLPIMSILFFMTIFDFYNKNKGAKLRLAVLIWNIGWLCVSIFSPGAANRQAGAGAHKSAVWAMSHSFIEAFRYAKIWGTMLYVIALIIVMVPVYWTLVGKCKFRFSWPFLVTLLSFSIYATAFTPNLYALGIIGAYRVQNMYRFMLYIIIAGNEIYWIGYIRRLLGEKTIKLTNVKVFNMFGMKIVYAIAAIAITAPMLIHYGGNTLTSLSAYYSLRNGTAKLYYEEAMAREEILKDESVTNAVLEPFTWPPYLLSFDDIECDESDWKNKDVAEYYGKESVRLREPTY